MAFTLITDIGGTSPSGGGDLTTSGVDTSGANLLIAVASWFTVGTVSDSKGNSWTALTAVVGTEPKVKIWYSVPSSVGASHTFSQTGGSYMALSVMAFSGGHTAPFGAEAAGGSTGSGTTVQPGSLTPSEDNMLLITGTAFNLPSTASIDSGFTIPATGQHNYTISQNEGVCSAYLIETTATAKNPTWTFAPSAELVAVMATFKIAATGTPAKLVIAPAGFA